MNAVGQLRSLKRLSILSWPATTHHWSPSFNTYRNPTSRTTSRSLIFTAADGYHSRRRESSPFVMASQTRNPKNVHLVVLVHGLWGEFVPSSDRQVLNSSYHQAILDILQSHMKSCSKRTNRPSRRLVKKAMLPIYRNYTLSLRRVTRAHTPTMGSTSAPAESPKKSTGRSEGSRRTGLVLSVISVSWDTVLAGVGCQLLPSHELILIYNRLQ